ncbi:MULTISPECIES: radical SAM/SPASM domain-containing protein [Segatella]|uniref:Radical SAM/SPASM domain Clo7bot peptide maturase n=2 Tax=Segatella TaxID=2974251 RepID=A0AA37HYT0_SEGBR|nr:MULTISPECIES: radical SAM protein [Segatella]UKK79270.1 radical SAM protein [Segatella baroniae B14]GJG28412.1 radical SAM/SPASM domain Clo7bot peptide maturase [Segatella bryantii]
MKWSRYNIIFKMHMGDEVLLYNTLSNVLLKLGKNDAESLMKIKSGKISVDSLEEQTKKALVDNKILISNDDIELAKFKLLKQYNRMDDSVLALTIAPTLACNLHCAYCFEQQHPSVFMNDDVENDIISFIKGHVNAKYVHITWFGGEPLLYFKRIVSLTKKIKSIQGIEKYEAEIITNGVNMNEKIASSLRELNINTVHVTIDGLDSANNERRIGLNHEDTFAKIVRGLDLLAKDDNISKTVRVNTDKTNSEQFVKVYDFVRKRYCGLNFNVYAGFIKDSYGCGNSCVGCLNNTEQGKFLIKSYKKLGVPTETLLPPRYNYECIARLKNGYLIGPKGDLYKCWTDLGNLSMCLGYINDLDNISIDLLSEYMVGNDPFCDSECMKCVLFPICGGGCPHSRIMNQFHGAKNDNCCFAKENIEEFIETYYHLQQSINNF